MEEFRILFANKKSRKRFFVELKEKSNSKTLIQLAKKIGVPYGRLKLWMLGKRSMPQSFLYQISYKFRIPLAEFEIKKINLSGVLSDSGKLGIKVLTKKYGKDWSRKLGSKGRKTLSRILKDNPKTYKKWRLSIKHSLEKKYGENWAIEMGKLGGKASIKKIGKRKLQIILEKAFRNSFRKKIYFRNERFRSMKEIEVAKLLHKIGMKYEYEKRLFGFYPDFLVRKNVIIEVVGFEWKPHIERTILKIETFLKKNYKVILYTYPNMKKYFEKFNIKIFTVKEDLEKNLGYIRV